MSPSQRFPAHRCVLALCLILGVTHDVRAQEIALGTDTGGIQPLRGYFSPTGFEHFDTKTGNLVLVFNDLTLPGDNGRDLRIQRTYNNETVTSPINAQESWRWSFGISGMVMRVLERPYNSSPPANFIEELTTTPVLIMADGSLRATVYEHYLYDGTSSGGQILWPTFRRHVVAAGFLRYDRTTRQLRMPDGMVCDYDLGGYLTHCKDELTSEIWIDRTVAANEVWITQAVGGQARQVRLDLDAAGQVVGMHYGGRQWTYQRSGADIVRATSPVGPDWVFEYANNRMTRIVTPGGAQIAYTYAPQSYSWGTLDVLSTRSVSGGEISAPGTWHFTWSPGLSATVRATPWAEIQTPTGRRIRYDYFTDPPQGLTLGGGTGFVTRTLSSATAEWLLREEREYIGLRLRVSPGLAGLATLTQEVMRERDPVTNSQRTKTTTYEYRAEHVFYDYHLPSRITEVASDGPPVEVEFTYLHREVPGANQPHFMVGLRATEKRRLDGLLIVDKQWTYNDPNWRLATVERSGLQSMTYGRDPHGNVAVATSSTNKVTTYGYSWGRISSVVGPEPGVVQTRNVNADGTIASESAAGLTTSYLYDSLGRVTHTARSDSTSVSTSYDNSTARSVVSQRGTKTRTTILDGLGRPIESIDASGVRTRTHYDAEGRVRYRGYPFTPGAQAGGTDIGTTIEYDALDRVLKEVEPDGVYVEWTHGLNTTTIRDRTNDRVTQLTTGPFGVTTLVDPNNSTWTYDYDEAGRLESISGPGQVVRSWTYDQQGRLATETSPEAGTVVVDEYDGDNLVKKRTDANGTQFTYDYSPSGRLTSVSGGGLTTTIAYEPDSNEISTMSTGGVTTAFTRDSAGRVSIRQDTVDGKVFESRYDYDADDRVVKVTYASGRRIGYEYGTSGRLIRVFDHDSGINYATDFVFHGSGALASYASGNGIVTSVAFDPQRYRVTGISSGALQLTYVYDVAGNVAQINDSRPGMNQTLEYDVLDRLKKATGGGAFYTTIDYAYDGHGNRQTANVPGAAVFEYHLNQPFHLKSINGIGNYQYDNNGNLTSGTGFTYTYRPDNRMNSATVNAEVTEFAYDAESLRVKRAVLGGAVSYFGRGPDGRILTEWLNSANGATAKDLIYAGSRVIGKATKTNLPPK